MARQHAGPRKTILQGTTLPQLSDGYTGKLLDKAFKDVFDDIRDRDDRLARTITLTITVKPAGNNRVSITPKVAVKVPPQVPPETIAKLDTIIGGMTFNPDCAENPDQKTMAEMVDEHGEVHDVTG